METALSSPLRTALGDPLRSMMCAFKPNGCPDPISASSDSATLTSWANPSLFAFRYSVVLIAGEIATFRVELPIAPTVNWYTAGGGSIPGSSAQTNINNITGTNNTVYTAWISCLTSGTYILEVAASVSGTVITRESNTTQGVLDVITTSSPLSHDGLSNYSAIHDFTWNAGDVYNLFTMFPAGLGQNLNVYDSGYTIQSIDFNTGVLTNGNNGIFTVPSTGLYHVEISIRSHNTGSLWFAWCCGVEATGSIGAVPSNQLTPYVPALTNTSKGNITRYLWYITENTTFTEFLFSTIRVPTNPITYTMITPPAASRTFQFVLTTFRAGLWRQLTLAFTSNPVYAFIPSFTLSPTSGNNVLTVTATSTTVQDPAESLTFTWSLKKTGGWISPTLTGSSITPTLWNSYTTNADDTFLFNLTATDGAGRTASTSFSTAQVTVHIVPPATLTVTNVNPAYTNATPALTFSGPCISEVPSGNYALFQGYDASLSFNSFNRVPNGEQVTPLIQGCGLSNNGPWGMQIVLADFHTTNQATYNAPATLSAFSGTATFTSNAGPGWNEGTLPGSLTFS